MLSTGADSSFSKQGIYDIAGNVFEWTLENGFDSWGDANASLRGGHCGNGFEFPASARWGGYFELSDALDGFRVSLY